MKKIAMALSLALALAALAGCEKGGGAQNAQSRYLPSEATTLTYERAGSSSEQIQIVKPDGKGGASVIDGLTGAALSRYETDKKGLYLIAKEQNGTEKRETLLQFPVKQGAVWSDAGESGQAASYEVVAADEKVSAPGGEFSGAAVVRKHLPQGAYEFRFYDKELGLVKTATSADSAYDPGKLAPGVALKSAEKGEKWDKMSSYAGLWESDGNGKHYIAVQPKGGGQATVEIKDARGFGSISATVKPDEAGAAKFSFKSDTGGDASIKFESGKITLAIKHADKRFAASQRIFEGEKTFKRTAK